MQDGDGDRQALLRALSDAAAAESALIDDRGSVVWAGNCFARRCGRPVEEIVGSPLTDVLTGLGAPVDPDALDRVATAAPDEPLPVLGFQGRAGPARWLQPVLRRADGIGGTTRYRVLALYSADPVMQRLAQAEKARDEVEARLKFDGDTGLPNAGHLTTLLRDALLRLAPNPMALMLIRIENAGSIVDTLGPAVLARAAREVAGILVSRLTHARLIARTGESEFAVLLDAQSGSATAIDTAHSLAASLTFTLPCDAQNCAISAAIGLATTAGAIGGQALLSNARIALNFRDRTQRARVRVFDDAMRTRLELRSRTRSELATAIEDDQIEPFFQPQIRLSDHAIIGFEVLVRWRHPNNGIVGPPAFLGIAEESGLLPAIDALVMKKAIASLAALRRQGHRAPRISLNCTGEALRDPNFVDRLMFEIDAHDLLPRDIGIEILETVAFSDQSDPAFQTIEMLKRVGILVGIDDFGRGQASILHLVTFNADVVKLDRSLIRDVCTCDTSRTVVEATVALADRLGMKTLAEGAETDEQIAFLGQLGCHYVQGFGIGHPMPLNEVPHWLANYPAPVSANPQRRAGAI